MDVNLEKIERLVKDLLIEIGEDPQRAGLIDTPRRVAKALAYLTSGYRMDPKELIGRACFPQETDSMVLIKDIELYSLCEHHMLPFFGRCHIAYLPKENKVPGCSKLARIVDMYSRRLQIQERLTEQIALAVKEGVPAEGVAVMIEARHLCMMMRGVEKQNSMLVTSYLLGPFREYAQTRQEFLSLVSKPKVV